MPGLDYRTLAVVMVCVFLTGLLIFFLVKVVRFLALILCTSREDCLESADGDWYPVPPMLLWLLIYLCIPLVAVDLITNLNFI